MQIRNGVAFSVAQPTHKRIFDKERAKDFDHVCFDIACLFGDLVEDSIRKLLWLCKDRSIDAAHLFQVFFGVFIEW
jgi:hypothetical protein